MALRINEYFVDLFSKALLDCVNILLIFLCVAQEIFAPNFVVLPKIFPKIRIVYYR